MKEETDAGAEGEGERRAEMCDIFACLNYNVKRERSYILQVLFMASVALVPRLRLRRRLHRRLLRLPPPSRLPAGRQHRVPRQVRLPRIACTRWVTHGEPALRNSHPQSSGAENEFLVVHNGVITNHEVLKQTLIRHGFTFESDTDIEVIPKLAKYVFDKSNEYSGDTTVTFSLVMLEVIRQLEGAYALIFKSRHYPNELIACKHGSPLLLGVNELTEESSKGSFFHDDKYPLQIGNPRELFLSSDANALVEHTRKVLVIEDGEVVHLKLNSSFVLFHWRGKLIRGGTCKAKTVLLGGLKDHLKAIRRSPRIVFIGCGTSYNAALAARPILEELSGIPVTMEIASDLLDCQGPIYREDTAVFVSQSGETADTLHALEYGLQNGAICVGITSTVGSAIARNTL